VTLDDIKDNQKKLNTENENFKEKDNVYYKIMNNKEKIWITEDLGINLIKKLHDKNHMGVKQLTLTLTPRYYFKNMHKHIKLICRACNTCVRNKVRFGNYKQPLSQLGPV